MSQKTHLLLFLSLTSLLLLSSLSLSLSKPHTDNDDDEDLSFLDDDTDDTPQNDAASSDFPDLNDDVTHNFDDDSFENDDDVEYDDNFDESQLDTSSYNNDDPVFEDPDVVVLKESNFTDFIEENKYVMVEFYAPWCGHCQALAPEYAAAATELKSLNESVVLAKVDATEEDGLAREYDVDGFPTILFFVDGEHKAYTGARTKDAIVTWIKKKIGPGVYNITTLDEAERILTSESKVVLGYLDSLVGTESEELTAASRLEDDVNFYQTVNPDVAKLFHIDPQVKRPALVLIKRQAEKINQYDGQFAKRSIQEFVSANKLPLVIKFTRESAPVIFESPIKKQLLLFATSNDSEQVIPTFEEAAKFFKGKLIFVYVELDDEELGKPVADYFGLSGGAPKVLGYIANEDSKKFILDREVTVDNIKVFGEDFVQDKLKPFYKSDPIPENNDGDVKVVVGNNFEEIVLDESKDVLLEIYAPWCGHCQTLEPTYNKLAKHLRDIESLVIAKMDGTTNEHPRAKAEGFPTLLFFPAGKKSSDPINVDADRTVKALYKFLRKHASIPFKVQKPTSTPESVKDEL